MIMNNMNNNNSNNLPKVTELGNGLYDGVMNGY